MLFPNDDSLPEYIKKLPEHVRMKWVSVFNEVMVKDGEEIAFVVANNWLKENITNPDLFNGYEGDGKATTADREDLIETVDVSEDIEVITPKIEETVTIEDLSKAVELLINKVDKLEAEISIPEVDNKSTEQVVLEFVKDGGLIKKADGTQYVDFILTDNGYDKEGHRISEALMNKWADQINNGELVLKGDVNHQDYDALMEKGVPKSKFISALKKFKQGFAKSIKAIVDNGKMWVRAMIEPGYENLIEKATGVSLEALLDFDDNTKEAYDGELGGFTFAVGAKPKNPRSQIWKQ